MNPQNLTSLTTRSNLCKIFVISAFILYIFIMYHVYKSSVCTLPIKKTLNKTSSSPLPPTNISQLVFSVVGSVKTWRDRRSYFQEWWQPNVTRGYIFFEKDPTQDMLPWAYDILPPYRVSENTTKLKVHSRHAKPEIIRIVRTILETFREGDKDVRWYVMGDDDTIFFMDNLVQLLRKYDHTKYVYIGGASESLKMGFGISFDMAYGGAGIALSYPLVEALVANLDRCIETYPNYIFGDQILSACAADLGVPITTEKGFHQIDLSNDISGFLSAHPQAPLISLHHLDVTSPIFPTMDRHKSIRHLMAAAKVDHSRLLQQTVCYHRQQDWSFSIAWGYSAYIYEQLIPRSILRRPLETFTPWAVIGEPPHYRFNTRLVNNDSCETPHIFFFHSITTVSTTTATPTTAPTPNNNYNNSSRNSNSSSDGNIATEEIMTTYVRYKPRKLPPCSSNQSVDNISEIRVYSPATKLNFVENRGECCDVLDVDDENTAEVRIRACEKDEMIMP